MKKLITLTIVALMAFGVGVAYGAASDQELLSTSVTVNSEFYMTLSANILDFGAVNQGASAAPSTIGVTNYSNTGNTWTVVISGPDLLHTDGVWTIPSDPNLQLYGFKTGGDGSVNITAATPLPAVATTIYSSAANDTGQDTWNLEFPGVSVPADTKAGAYSTTITLTMSE